MNRDQFKGQWSQFKGELKRQLGKFTDDDLMQIEGTYDKFIGSVQKRYGDQKEEVRRWVDQWHERRQGLGKPGTMPKAGLGVSVMRRWRCFTICIVPIAQLTQRRF